MVHSASITTTPHEQQPDIVDKSNMKTRRSVSFDPQVVMHRYLHINDYSDEEVQRAWYDGYELNQISETIRETLVLMMSNNMSASQRTDDKYCSRGLESLVGTASQRKHKNKVNSFNAVLGEQDLQWDEGIYDDELIADIYYVTTCESQNLANEIALQDEREAKRIRSEKSSSSNCRSAAMMRPPRLRQISGAAA